MCTETSRNKIAESELIVTVEVELKINKIRTNVRAVRAFLANIRTCLTFRYPVSELNSIRVRQIVIRLIRRMVCRRTDHDGYSRLLEAAEAAL